MRRRRGSSLGTAAATWAAVSLADKLDTVVGMFYAGEKPTGSRDPLGMRRQAHGIFKILVDLATLTGLTARPSLEPLLAEAAKALRRWRSGPRKTVRAMDAFLLDRYRYVLEQRGFDVRNVRAVLQETGYATARPIRCAQAVGSAAGVHGFAGFPETGDRLQAREEHRTRAVGYRLRIGREERSGACEIAEGTCGNGAAAGTRAARSRN